jgi:hypothetical protein
MGEIPSSIVAGIGFVGRGGGQVKALRGFKKGHHTVPDTANVTTNGFLAKVCESELTDDAEKMFQAVRTGLGYKRKDVVLSVVSPQAVLTAKDFVVEIFYGLEETEPSRFAVTTTLRDLRNVELARTQEFSAIFARRFSQIAFSLQQGAAVEAVIDAIEGLGDESHLAVVYPSDYRDCEITVAGIEARVRFTGDTLEMIFPRSGSPGELMDAFAGVCGAFSVSETLAALVVPSRK